MSRTWIHWRKLQYQKTVFYMPHNSRGEILWSWACGGQMAPMASLACGTLGGVGVTYLMLSGLSCDTEGCSPCDRWGNWGPGSRCVPQTHEGAPAGWESRLPPSGQHCGRPRPGVTKDSEACLSVPFSANLSSLSHTCRLIKYLRDTLGRTDTILYVEGIRVKENLLLIYVLIHGAGKGTCLTSRHIFVYSLIRYIFIYSLINMYLFTYLFIRYLSIRHIVYSFT